MKKVEIYEYYSFGYNYYILLNESSKKLNKDILEDIKTYIKFIGELDLKVTASSLELAGFDKDISNLKKACRGDNKMKPIEPELHNSIIEKLKTADKTLDAELNIISAYYINSNKRITNEILENNIEKLFAKDIFQYLPEIAKYDFDEAGKCLLLNRFTACAFHTLRGTEDVLKLYYEKLLDLSAKDNQTWWNFYEEIVKYNKTAEPKISEELLNNLNNLRKFYRNKTQHPQMIYNSDDVQDLLFNCIKSINEMIQDLIKRKLILDGTF